MTERERQTMSAYDARQEREHELAMEQARHSNSWADTLAWAAFFVCVAAVIIAAFAFGWRPWA